MMSKTILFLLTLSFAFYTGTTCRAESAVIYKVSKPAAGTIVKADTLLTRIENAIYYSYYNPAFWAKATKPLFTLLKIAIDKEGNVGKIRYSDSADSLFANAYLKKATFNTEKTLIEKYAKENSYSNTSILIPVSYEPDYGPGCSIGCDNVQELLIFNKQPFEGAAIMLAPIHILVLSHGNK
jgi:hypothetical protein